MHALDHSPDMIEVARTKLEALGLDDHVSFHTCDLAHLPFDDGALDGVTCQRVFHHVPDVAPAIGEVARVLRSGGFFYLSDSLGDATVAARALKALWRRVLERNGPQGSLGPDLPEGHEVMRAAPDLLHLLDLHGMTYDVDFFTHIGLTDRLSDRHRSLLIRSLSRPWKGRKGDLLFAYATKLG